MLHQKRVAKEKTSIEEHYGVAETAWEGLGKAKIFYCRIVLVTASYATFVSSIMRLEHF